MQQQHRASCIVGTLKNVAIGAVAMEGARVVAVWTFVLCNPTHPCQRRLSEFWAKYYSDDLAKINMQSGKEKQKAT